jgi:hypothetical protein
VNDYPQSLTDILIARRQKDREREAVMDATKTGGISGAVTGGIGSILTGGKSLGSILKAAAAGGLAGGAIGGGSQMVGNTIMGSPEPGDAGAYGTRGAVGGALAGGLGGVALGALLGQGKLKALAHFGPIQRALAEKGGGPLNNIATDKIKQWMASQGPKATPRIAAALGISGAAIGGWKGGEEGIDLDYIKSLKDDEDV